MLYVTIVVGIVLGSSVGFYIPVSVVVATLFRARRSLAFGIFRMGPGSVRIAGAGGGLHDRVVGLARGIGGVGR